MSDNQTLLRNLALRVSRGRLDAGPKVSFEEYNGRGSWAEATDSERKGERGALAKAIRAIAKDLAA